MGSGKSTVGPLLAKRLSYRFVDLDERVMELADNSIAEVFAEEGQAAFRTLEAVALGEAMMTDRIVISTGGGSLLGQESLRQARDTGAVVYLRMAVRNVTERLNRASDRPLLLDSDGRMLSKDALRDRIESLLVEREPIYEQAEFIVDVDLLSPVDIADAIVEALNAKA